MIDQNRLGALRGADVYDPDNAKIGSVGQVWVGRGDQPDWISVKTGLFGLRETLVPLHNADFEGDQLRVPYSKATVKDAPNINVDADEPLSTAEVGQLYEYYEISGSGGATAGAPTGTYAEERGRETAGASTGTYAEERDRETAGAPTDRRTGDDDAMTLSEERLNVDTQTQRTGTARLRKYVTTENVQQTVPVQREEVRLEREPITDANRDAAHAGPDISEAEHEVTLHEERPVVQKETVPVERVRLGKETVTDEETVNEQVRREQVDSDLRGQSNR